MLHIEKMLLFTPDEFFQPIKVSDVVASINLSHRDAIKLFRRVLGTAIKEQLTLTRISHAQMLLSESDAKVLIVALESGFKSLSAFFEAFEKASGVSPAQYRRNALGPTSTNVRF